MLQMVTGMCVEKRPRIREKGSRISTESRWRQNGESDLWIPGGGRHAGSQDRDTGCSGPIHI